VRGTPLVTHGVDVAVADAREGDVDEHVVVAQIATLDRDRLEGCAGGGDRQG
jgi:hypothetical protein